MEELDKIWSLFQTWGNQSREVMQSQETDNHSTGVAAKSATSKKKMPFREVLPKKGSCWTNKLYYVSWTIFLIMVFIKLYKSS